MDEIDCGRFCLRRNGCVSYNYQYENDNTTVLNCELNSQTKETKPQDYQVKRGFLYFASLYEREVRKSNNLIKNQSWLNLP